VIRPSVAELHDLGMCAQTRRGDPLRFVLHMLADCTRVRIIATRLDGSRIVPESLGHVTLSLAWGGMDGRETIWRTEHALLAGAERNIGISTMLLDFAADACGFQLRADPRKDRDGHRAIEGFERWRQWREGGGRTSFKPITAEDMERPA